MHSSKSQLKHQTPASRHSMKGISIAEHAILGFLAELAIPVGVRCWFSCPREYVLWEILHRGVKQKQFDNSSFTCILQGGTQRTCQGPWAWTYGWTRATSPMGTGQVSVGLELCLILWVLELPQGKGAQPAESLITHDTGCNLTLAQLPWCPCVQPEVMGSCPTSPHPLADAAHLLVLGTIAWPHRVLPTTQRSYACLWSSFLKL